MYTSCSNVHCEHHDTCQFNIHAGVLIALCATETEKAPNYMCQYDRYVECFYEEHRKVEYTIEKTWDYRIPADAKRLGYGKTGDHIVMVGDAYLLPSGKVIEYIQCNEGFYPPQIRTFEGLKDWNDYCRPMPYMVWQTG